MVKSVDWKAKRNRKRLFLILTLLGLCALLMPIPQHIKIRLQTMTERPAGFMSGRGQLWQTSLELIRKYPVTGIGLNRFHHEYQLHGPPDLNKIQDHPHQSYLQIAVEQGIPSLILFLWMLSCIVQQLYRIRQHTGFWNVGLFIGASAFLIAAIVYGLADNILHRRTLLLFWFIIGLIFYSHNDTDEAQNLEPQLKVQKYEKNLETG